MNRIHVPATGLEDWRLLPGKPDDHGCRHGGLSYRPSRLLKFAFFSTLCLTVGVTRLALAQATPAAGNSSETPLSNQAAQATPGAPTVLPGRGLAEHDFFYTGESKDRRMYIVRKGQVVWSYDDPAGRGEISDATLLANGNVLLAHQFAVKLVSPDKKVLWNYDVPQGHEVHTAQMIGNAHVLFIQNGDPALLKVVNILTGETRKEFPLPVGNPKSVHLQFRHARLTTAGTLLVAHMDANKVSEYDADGKELWSVAAARPWGVTPLSNGNVLITESLHGVREVTREGKTVWEFTMTDAPGYQMPHLQQAWRLRNGHTLLNVWVNQWNEKMDKANLPVQALEVSPDKAVVWALRSWADPDLGPASIIQVLDEGVSPENFHFGDIH